uniref:Putative ribosome-binding protein 1-like isoform x5 n=1 Tax=Panstrongylus lignarius TaxID=156445 RepID=A0A224X8I7_9HEMI
MDVLMGALCLATAVVLSFIIYMILSQFNVKEDSYDEAKANRRKIIKQGRLEGNKGNIKKLKRSQKDVKEKKDMQKIAEVVVEEQHPKEENKKKIMKDTDGPVEPKEIAAVSLTNNASMPSTTLTSCPPPSNAPVKQSKKKRQIIILNQIKNEKEAISVNLLISLIQKSEISRSEIQMLIDALLNKQQEDVSEWLKGRQDPIVKIKKQLMDTEKALTNEKEISVGLQAKLKSLSSDLLNERGLARSSKEQIAGLQGELRSMIQKWQTLAEEKQTLHVNVQQVQQQLNEAQNKLKEKDEQIISHRMAVEESHENILALQSKVSQLRAKLDDNVRVIEEYQKVQRAYKELQAELNTKDRAVTDANGEIEQLLVNNKHLYQQNEQLSKQNDQLSSQVNSLCQEVNSLREKTESLANMNTENWGNGYSSNNTLENLAEIESRLEEKTKQVEEMATELEVTRIKLNELNLNLSRNKSEHNKTQSSLDTASNEIKLLKDIIESLNSRNQNEDTVEQLKNNINEKNKEIAVLREEIKICKERNNSLQHKNWKIAEALTNAEKTLQNNIKNEQNSVATSESNIEKIHETILRLVKTLSPHLSLDDNKCDIDVCLTYLEEAILSKSLNGTDDSKSLQETQQEIDRLQTLVITYKRIIIDTEKVLNQLQIHIEHEEAKWKSKVTSLEDELMQLRNSQ